MEQSEFQTVETGESWQVVRPCDCAIAFGIPVSIEGFLRDPEKGFARQFHGRRERMDEFIRDYESTTAVIRGCGAEVIADLTLESFSELFSRGRYAVVILFSHVENGSVEFRDGFASISTVAEHVSPEYDGIVDVTTCGSRELFRNLRRGRPACFPFYATAETIDARAWLFFYKALFEYLNGRPLTYPRAHVELVHGFLGRVPKEWSRMKKLADLLQLYLERIGRHGTHLGPERPVTKEDNLFLVELLSRPAGQTDFLINLALVGLFVSYGVAIFVLIYVRNDSVALKWAFAALLTFTLAILRALRRFWIDKSVMNMLMLALRELPPEQAAAFVDALYWRIVKGQTRRW